MKEILSNNNNVSKLYAVYRIKSTAFNLFKAYWNFPTKTLHNARTLLRKFYILFYIYNYMRETGT
jgi:DNA gyrase inhibitor GyrI